MSGRVVVYAECVKCCTIDSIYCEQFYFFDRLLCKRFSEVICFRCSQNVFNYCISMAFESHLQLSFLCEIDQLGRNENTLLNLPKDSSAGFDWTPNGTKRAVLQSLHLVSWGKYSIVPTWSKCAVCGFFRNQEEEANPSEKEKDKPNGKWFFLRRRRTREEALKKSLTRIWW